MNAPSFDKFAGSIAEKGQIFYDSSLIDRSPVKNSDSHLIKDAETPFFGIPATQLAMDNSLKGLANIIILGKMLAAGAFEEIANETQVRTAIEKNTKKANLLELNFKALNLGLKFQD
jgi:2-oxoglutarate ferredoxin oxidoreductase subunit gamma